jgi:hypothetical protein
VSLLKDTCAVLDDHFRIEEQKWAVATATALVTLSARQRMYLAATNGMVWAYVTIK